MGESGSLILIISSALALVGLLLVFMAFFSRLVGEEAEKVGVFQVRKTILIATPCLIGISAITATLGLLSLWGILDAAVVASWLLVALIWLIVVLSFFAVKAGRRK
jgi:hypothetical protein